MSLARRAEGDELLAARAVLASRGVAMSRLALAGALLEVRHQRAIRALAGSRK